MFQLTSSLYGLARGSETNKHGAQNLEGYHRSHPKTLLVCFLQGRISLRRLRDAKRRPSRRGPRGRVETKASSKSRIEKCTHSPVQAVFVFFSRSLFSVNQNSDRTALVDVGYVFDPMLTPTSACLWILLFWLAASDTNLPWISMQRRSTAKKAGRASGQAKTEGYTISAYARMAVYVVMTALLWSCSSSPAAISQPVYQAEPSFRVGSAGLSSEKSPPSGIELDQEIHQDSSDDVFHEAIHNETLGFQKIFVVNLPERTDKRDALSLVSALTNIKLTWTSAIRGTSVPDKALPLGVDREGWRDGGIGSWRSQMNIIRT